MSLVHRLTPGRRFVRRPGVFFVLCLALAACDAPALEDRSAVLQLDGDTARLAAGASIHDVRVRAAAAGTAEFEPATVVARPADVLRFVAGDAHTHAISFDPARLAPQAHDFLRATGQLRGPPLIAEDAAWIVGLTDAPPGAYPFLCLTHGGRGLLTIAAP